MDFSKSAVKSIFLFSTTLLLILILAVFVHGLTNADCPTGVGNQCTCQYGEQYYYPDFDPSTISCSSDGSSVLAGADMGSEYYADSFGLSCNSTLGAANGWSFHYCCCSGVSPPPIIPGVCEGQSTDPNDPPGITCTGISGCHGDTCTIVIYPVPMPPPQPTGIEGLCMNILTYMDCPRGMSISQCGRLPDKCLNTCSLPSMCPGGGDACGEGDEPPCPHCGGPFEPPCPPCDPLTDPACIPCGGTDGSDCPPCGPGDTPCPPCGTGTEPDCPPPPPACGTAGEPACPPGGGTTCGTPTTLPCPICGWPGEISCCFLDPSLPGCITTPIGSCTDAGNICRDYNPASWSLGCEANEVPDLSNTCSADPLHLSICCAPAPTSTPLSVSCRGYLNPNTFDVNWVATVSNAISNVVVDWNFKPNISSDSPIGGDTNIIISPNNSAKYIIHYPTSGTKTANVSAWDSRNQVVIGLPCSVLIPSTPSMLSVNCSNPSSVNLDPVTGTATITWGAAVSNGAAPGNYSFYWTFIDNNLPPYSGQQVTLYNDSFSNKGTSYTDSNSKIYSGLGKKDVNIRVIDDSTGKDANVQCSVVVYSKGVECDIDFLSVKDVIAGETANVSFACASSVPSASLSIFDAKANATSPLVTRSVLCGVNSNGVSYAFDANAASGVFVARLTTANCSKDAYFSVKVNNTAKKVPDNSLFVVALLIAVVVVLLYQKKKE